MSIPEEVSLQLSKMYELVTKQVKNDYEEKLQNSDNNSDVGVFPQKNAVLLQQLESLKLQNTMDSENHQSQLWAKEKQLTILQSRYDNLNENQHTAASPQTNEILLKQLESLKLQSTLDDEKHHNQLSARENQLSILQSRYDKLNEDYHAEQSYVEIVEYEKALALNEPKQNDTSALKEELQQLTDELDDLNAHNRVLKHHYSQLIHKHESLKIELKSSEDKLAVLADKHQQQSADFELSKKQLNELSEQSRHQLAKISSQKNDLALTMGSYYDGVLNIDKSTSKNIPKNGK